MKKTIFAAMLLAAMNTAAQSSIFIDGSETIRISPNYLGKEYTLRVKMHTEATCDRWVLNTIFPCDLRPIYLKPLDGMRLSYNCDNGIEATLDVPLCMSSDFSAISAFVGINQYYSPSTHSVNSGIFKWEQGDFDLFEIRFIIEPTFRRSAIPMSGIMDCGHGDSGLDNEYFYSSVEVFVGYEAGDVNGDGEVTIADVTFLIDYLLNGTTLDWFQFEAADINGDYEATIADATMIIDSILRTT